MENCLVTKLKGVANNNNLPFYGKLRLSLSNLYSSNQNLTINTIGIQSSFNIKVVEGSFSGQSSEINIPADASTILRIIPNASVVADLLIADSNYNGCRFISIGTYMIATVNPDNIYDANIMALSISDQTTFINDFIVEKWIEKIADYIYSNNVEFDSNKLPCVVSPVSNSKLKFNNQAVTKANGSTGRAGIAITASDANGIHSIYKVLTGDVANGFTYSSEPIATYNRITKEFVYADI